MSGVYEAEGGRLSIATLPNNNGLVANGDNQRVCWDTRPRISLISAPVYVNAMRIDIV